MMIHDFTTNEKTGYGLLETKNIAFSNIDRAAACGVWVLKVYRRICVFPVLFWKPLPGSSRRDASSRS